MKVQLKVFAHRGASSSALENTMKAFERAIQLGADGIELDVQCSKDGHLFIYHDNNLSRLSGKSRLISNCTADEIKKIRIGNRYWRIFSCSRIPSVEDFLEWLKFHEVPVNIELKETLIERPEIIKKWVHQIRLPEGSHFSSFHMDLLKIVKEIRPDIETAYIISKKFDWSTIEQLDFVDSIHAHKKYYQRNLLDLTFQAKKTMRFYGIVGDEPFLRQPHPVVVGWITDFPAKVKTFIS